MKVCLVGDYAVGKTSIADRLVYNRFRTPYIPTIGTQIIKKELEVPDPRGEGTVRVDMTIWDIMGQKGVKDLLNDAYFEGARGILAVCDVTREETLKGLEYWVRAVRKVAGKIPIQILANKIDLEDQIRIREDDVSEVGRSLSSEFQLTSAKTGENVDKALRNLVAEHMSMRLHWDRTVTT
jgi:small GTP-binding protein